MKLINGRHIWWRSYQTSILLLLQLVTRGQSVPVLLPYVFFHFLIGQVDSIIEVTAPEHIVMGVEQTALARAAWTQHYFPPQKRNFQTHYDKSLYHGEAEPTCDLTVVVVPLLHLGLSCSKVGADEADAGRVEQQADGHTPFIARGPAHSRFYCVDCNIPGKGIECSSVSIQECKAALYGWRVSSPYLMKGACWGRIKTNRHTPTSCSEASSTYL